MCSVVELASSSSMVCGHFYFCIFLTGAGQLFFRNSFPTFFEVGNSELLYIAHFFGNFNFYCTTVQEVTGEKGFFYNPSLLQTFRFARGREV